MQYLILVDKKFKLVEANSGKELSDYYFNLGKVVDLTIPFPLKVKSNVNASMNTKTCIELFKGLKDLMHSTNNLTVSIDMMLQQYTKSTRKNRLSAVSRFMDKLVSDHYRAKFKKIIEFLEEYRRYTIQGESMYKIFEDKNFDQVALVLLKTISKSKSYEVAFEKCAEYYENKSKYKSGLISAMLYPFLLFALLYVALLVFIFYVVPKFLIFFKQFPKIPPATEFVFNVFTWLRVYYFYYTVGAIILIFVFINLILLDKFKVRTKIINKLSLIPIVGDMFKYEFLRYFMYEFNILYVSGESINNILEFFMKNTKNEFFKPKVNALYSHSITGVSLADSLSASDMLEPQDLYYLSIADSSGSLDAATLELSEKFNKKYEMYMKSFKIMLNAIAMVMVIFFLLTLFMSVYMPLIKGMMEIKS